MSQDDVSSRLEQSTMGGTPKVNPDEQREYLGTFKERVALCIKIKDLKNPDAIKALQTEIDKNHDYQVIINGNLDHDLISPYLKTASSNNVKFIIRTDSFYRTSDDDYGIVYANNQSINESQIDFEDKYKQVSNTDTKKEDNTENNSVLSKLKKLFK